MAQYNAIKTALDSSENEQRTINSKLMFAASLQCTDEVTAVSRGTSRPRTLLTIGIERLTFAVESDAQ